MINQLILKRVSEGNGATCGVLFIEKMASFLTLENDRTNFRIPAGTYDLKRVDSPKFGETFSVEGVPGHDGLRIHCGNTVDDTEGCILIGTSYGKVRTKPAVWRSREAFELFMQDLHGIDLTKIVIRDV
jgi:hypothetical protein